MALTPSLQDLAKKAGLDVGEEMTGYGPENPTWLSIFVSQFNVATIDWGLNWIDNEPTQGHYDFSVMDREVALAQRYGMKIRGEPLLIPPSLPDWVRQANLSKSALTSLLIDHVKTVVSRYRGEVSEWAVVEEPYAYPFRTNDYLYQRLGYSYIDIAFKAAREADPSAMLIYGDAGNQSMQTNDPNGLTTPLTQETVKRLKSEGLIDAVALEMHMDASDMPTNQDIITTMKSYGVPVIISSFDVDLQHVGGTEAQRLALQAKVASDVVTDCRQSGVCKDFSLWGIWDKYSMWQLLGQTNSEATPFDMNLQPKPEYFAIKKALE